MEYLYHNCIWDKEGLYTLPVMSKDAKSSCLMYSSYEDPDVITLGNLQVSPSVRRDGRGKELLHFCEDIARSKGFETMHLKAQTGSWMLAWYIREGYEPFSEDDSTGVMYTWLEKDLNKEPRNTSFFA
jgi:GNAT superfamily N-acetyltransferase